MEVLNTVAGHSGAAFQINFIKLFQVPKLLLSQGGCNARPGREFAVESKLFYEQTNVNSD